MVPYSIRFGMFMVGYIEKRVNRSRAFTIPDRVGTIKFDSENCTWRNLTKKTKHNM